MSLNVRVLNTTILYYNKKENKTLGDTFSLNTFK